MSPIKRLRCFVVDVIMNKAVIIYSWSEPLKMQRIGLDNNSISICIAIFYFSITVIWFLNTFTIFRYTLPVFPIYWFICGVWLRWINMSTARFEIKTWHGCFIWMYLWRKPTGFRKVSMPFSFYLIKLLSWVEQLRLQPLPGKPLVLPLSQHLLLADNQIARHDISFHYMSTHVAEWQ